MTPTRRRVLRIVAGAVPAILAGSASMAAPRTLRWTGIALGAECEITLVASDPRHDALIEQAVSLLNDVEDLFSLYRPASTISRLNASGSVLETDERFFELLDIADRAHNSTEGLFDPTVQSRWTRQRRADGHRPTWKQVAMARPTVRLPADTPITLNGIAQGYATDLIRRLFATSGVGSTLINIGEFAALGGPWILGIEDPEHGIIGHRTLQSGAIATSSPLASQRPDGKAHISHPVDDTQAPRWSTVSVEAETATMADACSTAFCLADKAQIRRTMRRLPEIRSVLLVDQVGDLTTMLA